MRGARTGEHHQVSAQNEAALISFDQLLLAYLQARTGAKSAVRDLCAAQHLFPVFTERMMSDIRPSDIRQYLTARRAAGAVHCRIGSLEMVDVAAVELFARSLPNRQLRN